MGVVIVRGAAVEGIYDCNTESSITITWRAGPEETAIKVKQKHENLLRLRDWLEPAGRLDYLNGPVRDQNLNLFPAPPLIWHQIDKPELPPRVMTFLDIALWSASL